MSIDNEILGNTQLAQQRGKLIEKIYSTITKPDNWCEVISELAANTDSRSARLLIMNSEANSVISSFKHNIDENYHQQYVEHFVNKCPWRPEIRKKPPGRFYSSQLHFCCNQSDFYKSEFYNDWAGPQDIHHGAASTIFQYGEQAVQLLVQRTKGQGSFTGADVDFLNCFVPHMQQALHLAAQIEENNTRSKAIEISAESEVLPFILLDFSLRPIYCTPAAELLLNSESALLLSKEQLHLVDRDLDQCLQRLLNKCLVAADSRIFNTSGETLEVQRPQATNLHLLLKPVHPDALVWGGHSGRYVAVYIYDPETKNHIDRERLCELYALSKAEIRVAMEIIVTPDPAKVAKRCFISLHTVRSHLKTIFAKTGANNQADLVKLLLAGPARRR